ncbi:MAG TPA: AzlC family ABC transporter permease [Chloroflexota bacterium]|nr:AzlC family ABC transporter permease [Chloroflexota bacterium]
MTDDSSVHAGWWEEMGAGARAIAPMLVGVVPFGLVAGATPVAHHLGGAVAIGFSTIVFAGASQLAALVTLSSGGSAVVAAVAAWTINLRLMLYSASLAPHLARERLRIRLLVAYLLTDQAYAISITRWGRHDDPRRRLPYFLGGALVLWSAWQVSTIVGVFIGAAVPPSIPLGFTVPLVFLVLLIPTIANRPSGIAAVVGGVGAVLGAALGAGQLALMVGAVSGITAGAVAEWRWPPSEPNVPMEASG